MYTNGNNALVIAESDIVETLTAYSDKELSALVESAYNLGKQQEKIKNRRAKKEKRLKRKERIETLKLTLALLCGGIGFPALMILHWIIMGY